MDSEVDEKGGRSLPESGPGVRARAFPPLLSAVARAAPEDFAVDERHGSGAAGEPGLDGAGEHLWLRVRKRLANTEEVATALAERCGVGIRAVGHSGMKDRRAVTTQWFSVCTTGAARGDALAAGATGAVGEGAWEVLSAGRHSRKLRRGTHSGNRFRIVLREPDWGADAPPDAAAAVAERADAVRAHGFANRFGPQRFGRGGANVAQALAMFSAGRGRGRRTTATRRGLLLSAARSAVFNAVLDERVRRGDWRTPLDGEPLVLAGSGSFFVPDPAAPAPSGRPLAERLRDGDVSTSGPLPGAGEPPARGACAAFEAALVEADPTLARLAAGLVAADVAAARRALVARAPDLRVALEDDRLVLDVTLAPGTFATALLEAFGDVRDADPAVPHSAP